MRTRAAVLHELGAEQPYTRSRPLAVEELELTDPGPGELLVRIEVAGVCHSDLSVVDGNRPRPVPMALGHEAAGVVEAVGPGTTGIDVGDHVVLTFVPACGVCGPCNAGTPALCRPAATANTAGHLLAGGSRLHRGDGEVVHHHLGVSAFATHAVVARGSAVRIDPDLPLEVAALVGCGVLTGVGAVVHTAGVRPGDGVAVFGLGGVGLSAVLGAGLVTADPVVAVDPVASKRELALELGATHAVGPEEAGALIAEVTGGLGVTHAFECVGSARVLEAAYDATAPGGTTVAVGLPHPSQVAELPAVSIVGQARTVRGSYLGSAAPQRDVPMLLRLWRAGRLPLERLQSARLDLDQVNDAMDALAGGQVVRQLLLPQHLG